MPVIRLPNKLWPLLALLPILAVASLLPVPQTLAAKRESLSLRPVSLRLPGPPAAIVSTDLDGNGRRDLLLVMAYTDVESVGVDRIENMVQISTVIPTLFEKREARAYLQRADGSYEELERALPLPPSVLAITQDGSAVRAMTDDGVSTIGLLPDDPPTLAATPYIADRPVAAGAGSFFSTLDWAHDVDGDRRDDLLLPAADGLAIYLDGKVEGERRPVQRLRLPDDRLTGRSQVERRYPVPRVELVDGDTHPDLVFRGDWQRLHVLLGNGDGTFRPIHDSPPCPEAASLVLFASGAVVGTEGPGEIVHFGDLDDDGRAELVTMEELEPKKSGMRAELKNAKKPKQRFRFYHLGDDLRVEDEPYQDFVALGYSFDDSELDAARMSLFQDLDGDGRKDMITVTLRFSVLQVLKVLTTRRIGVGLDFHVRVQLPDGSFHAVDGLDLSEKVKLNLNDLKFGRLAQFAGDFDGDGKIDFVHFGRGKQVTIHRGQPGCRYPKKPDLVIELEEEPRDLGLVRVADLDGDGRSDLAITQPLPEERPDVSPPVRLDLYLSGETP